MGSHRDARRLGRQHLNSANWVCLLGALVLGAILGCGDKSDLSPVTGLVTVDGKPVPGAQVLFTSAGGRPASDETDADGRYVLSTYQAGDGALIGEYSVTVTARPTVRVNPAGVMGPTTGRPKTQHGATSPVPAKYSDAANPILKVEVKAGDNDIPLELTQN